MRVLVTGITGAIGAALVPRLLAEGHDVRGFSRRPDRATPAVPVIGGDALDGQGLDAALDGIDVAYYLIHSMEPTADGAFADRDRRAAERFVQAAQRAGAPRAIYLGGPVPAGPPSRHLASRLEVERVLLEGLPGSTALRASIVISATSRSFRMLVRLVERMPVLPMPAWRVHRTRPIDGRDVLAYLVRAAVTPQTAGRSLDVAGPDELTFAAMMGRIRDLLVLGRPELGLPVSATPLVSRLAAVVTGEDHELVGPLMESLEHDLLPRDEEAQRLMPIRLHAFDAAVERALRDWEQTEVLAAR